MLDMLGRLKERFARPPSEEPPGRLQSFARALKYTMVVAVPVCILILYQFAADLFLATPGEIFLIALALTAVATFVFRAPGFHASVLLFLAILFFYPVHLIFVSI